MRRPKTILAENLTAIIKRRGYRTPELFAHENGFSKSWVYRIIRKQVDPQFSSLVKLAKALKVDLNSLYPGKKRAG